MKNKETKNIFSYSGNRNYPKTLKRFPTKNKVVKADKKEASDKAKGL